MILNRPTNLWLGALTALFNVLVLFLHDAVNVDVSAELFAAVNIAMGTVIILIASQPPILNSGDPVVVKTTNGKPDQKVTFDNKGVVASSVDVVSSSPKVDSGS